MKELNIRTLPVTRDSKLEGLITIGDIATSYMDVYDSGILSKARTQYRNIASTIDGTIIARKSTQLCVERKSRGFLHQAES